MAKQSSNAKTLQTNCCIVGGGPAGMMLGLLLARSGIDVLVLEKHQDFLRDFRGDTIHPSTLNIIDELGLLADLLRRPHQKARQISGKIGDTEIIVADFAKVPSPCPYVVLMPQWDFLNFLAEHAQSYPAFKLRMQYAAKDLMEAAGTVVGISGTSVDGPFEVHANLVVGADGRHSIIRERAGLKVRDIGAPIDVLWMRLPRQNTDPDLPVGRFDLGKIFVMLYRGDYWQCAYVIPKGTFATIQQRGLEPFRQDIAALVPFLGNRVEALTSWDDIKQLTVTVDQLQSWCRPGLLCIGDAAHAMSPVGGVGINLAIQDAVATANIIAEPLKKHSLEFEHLKQVQRRREFPTRLTQRAQVFIQERILKRVINNDTKIVAPWFIKLYGHLPFLRSIPAWFIGIGVRPEHIRTQTTRQASANVSRGERGNSFEGSP